VAPIETCCHIFSQNENQSNERRETTSVLDAYA